MFDEIEEIRRQEADRLGQINCRLEQLCKKYRNNRFLSEDEKTEFNALIELKWGKSGHDAHSHKANP